MKSLLSESVDGFGLPMSEEGKRHDYKGLLASLMAAVEKHMELMANPGEAEGEEEDPLPAALEATKEALEPEEEEGGESDEEEAGEMLDVPSDEAAPEMGESEEMDEMARKVTDQVTAAFIAGQPKRVAKTHTDGESFFLHGNEIARKKGKELEITNAGWPTVTTRERLNGILQAAGINARVSQKANTQMLNDEPWDGEWTKVGKIGGAEVA